MIPLWLAPYPFLRGTSDSYFCPTAGLIRHDSLGGIGCTLAALPCHQHLRHSRDGARYRDLGIVACEKSGVFNLAKNSPTDGIWANARQRISGRGDDFCSGRTLTYARPADRCIWFHAADTTLPRMDEEAADGLGQEQHSIHRIDHGQWRDKNVYQQVRGLRFVRCLGIGTAEIDRRSIGDAPSGDAAVGALPLSALASYPSDDRRHP